MASSTGIAFSLDRRRPLAAAALGSGVYVPQRGGGFRPQRPPAPRQQRPAGRIAANPRDVAPPQQRTAVLLQHGIFALKLVAATLAAGTVTLFLANNEDVRPTNPTPPMGAVRLPTAPDNWAMNTSTQYRTAPEAAAVEQDPARSMPSNYPRSVKTLTFTAPSQEIAAAAPPRQLASMPPVAVALPPAQAATEPQAAAQPKLAALSPATPAPTAPPQSGNELSGKPLRYLIGGSAGSGRDTEVTMVSYSTNSPVRNGVSIAYGNLFDELNTRQYGPYLHTSDTAAQYGEGQIDPKGPGWEKNLREQYARRKQQGFKYIELDNPDAYNIKDVIGAIELAATYDLKVIAKNPGITNDPVTYVKHPNVVGIIVEKGAGNAADMDTLRRKAGKPDLPVWFVSFGSGRSWGQSVASSAKSYHNMGVTHSSAGEYGNSIDLQTPSLSNRAASM
jgi:hypothetical protein